MATTIAYPSDAVSNGATGIQSTTFALVAADYVKVDLSTVSRFIADHGSQEFLPNPNNKGANGLPEWQFFMRKDLSGANAAYSNLIGLKTVVVNRNVSAWNEDLSEKKGIPIGIRRVEAHQWYCISMTMDSGVVVPIWTVDFASYTVVNEPSGTIHYGDGSYNVIEELLGFLVTRVAATVPTNARAIAAAYGRNPLG